MKKKLTIILAACVMLAGCVHLPDFSSPPVPPGVTNAHGAVVSAPAPVPPSTASPSTVAIQHAVNWQTTLFILAGVACLALCGFLAYAGQVVPAVKVGLAGLLLPIFGIWFAYHWLLVVIITLLSAAAFFLATHYAVVAPLLTRLDASAAKADAWLAAQAKKI